MSSRITCPARTPCEWSHTICGRVEPWDMEIIQSHMDNAHAGVEMEIVNDEILSVGTIGLEWEDARMRQLQDLQQYATMSLLWGVHMTRNQNLHGSVSNKQEGQVKAIERHHKYQYMVAGHNGKKQDFATIAPTKLTCSASTASGYVTEEVEVEQKQLNLTTMDHTNFMCPASTASGYVTQEVEVEQKQHNLTTMAPTGLATTAYGYVTEEVEVEQKQHNLTTMAPTKLTCPASTACGYVTEEVGLEFAMRLIQMHLDMVHPAEETAVTNEQAKMKVGSKKARRRQRVQDARRRQQPHQQRAGGPLRHIHGDEVPIQHQKGGDVPDQHQQGDEGHIQHQQVEEVPIQHQWRDGVPTQLKQGEEVHDQQHYLKGERFPTSSIASRRERVSSSTSRGTRVLLSTSGGKKFLTLKLRLFLSSTSTNRGSISYERLVTTEKHIIMSLQQRFTMAAEQEKRSKFNLQQIHQSLNLMTMEQNEQLTTQSILSRGNRTWEKKQMSEL